MNKLKYAKLKRHWLKWNDIRLNDIILYEMKGH